MQDTDKYYIYYHIDPRDGLPRYIGKGSGSRAWEFSKTRRNSAHFQWISELKSVGMEPTVFIGKASNDEDLVYFWEEMDVTSVKKIGIVLLNKIKGGKRNMKKPLNCRQIYCNNNGKTYNSMVDAAIALKLTHSGNIGAVCRGVQVSYMGYKFQYLDPELREKALQIRELKIKNKECGRFKKGQAPWNKKD